ncbi:MAG: iron-containing alcohol dehydrogenase [Deltaproteobacteria bacterium]|nr:iron-containing alcohol dehydrogenase [Deltaproteobacteria bacterium]
MHYWFTHPKVKELLPLAKSSAVRGIASRFSSPRIFMGSAVLPEGPVMGPNAVAAFGEKCPKKKAFIETDAFGKISAATVAKALEANGFQTTIWDKAAPEAPLDNVAEAVRSMMVFEPDLIIAVGGGSVIDGAKGAWVLYERPDITDLGMVSPFLPLGLRKKAVFAAIPTTSGTGSECTAALVAHDTKSHRKIPIMNADLLPDFAVLVPEFTMTMPPKLTAGTGLDVLAHAMDCILVGGGNEMTDALAVAATEAAFTYLPRAYKNGEDKEARYQMIVAASMAGMAFGQSGVSLTHSFGHSVGSLFNIHHGVAVGLFIPYAFQFYRSVTDRYLPLCKALEVKKPSKEESLKNLIKKFRDLCAMLDVPLAIKDLGISKNDFETKMKDLMLYTMEDVETYLSPRPMTEQECEQILRHAYEGKDIDF